jgi:hypothetical protein
MQEVTRENDYGTWLWSHSTKASKKHNILFRDCAVNNCTGMKYWNSWSFYTRQSFENQFLFFICFPNIP